MPLYRSTDPTTVLTAFGGQNATLLASGEETMLRDLAVSGSLATGTGNLRLSYFVARKTETTTQARVITGSTAAAATPTVCRIGLYSINAAGDGTLVASTANDTTLFAATATAYTKSWSVAYAKTAGTTYALGVLVVSGAATPTLAGAGVTTAAEAGIAPRLCASVTGQADLPGSFLVGGLTAGTTRFYGAVLP